MVHSVLISQAIFAFVRQKSHRESAFWALQQMLFPGSIEVIFRFAPSWIKKNRLSTSFCQEAIFSSAAYSVLPSRVGELVVAFVVEGGDVFADNG